MSRNTNQAEQSILQRLAGDDPDDIRSAAFEAGELRLTAASELLVKHIFSPNLGVQEAAEYALRRIRGTAVVEALASLLRSDEASVRNSAMDILREISSDDIKVMYQLLHDSDPDVRIFAADILGSSSSTLAVAMLSQALATELEVNVRYQICVSLGILGYGEAAPALRKALEDGEEWVQFAAVEALAKIRDDSCADILLQALGKSSPLVASTIISALGEMGNMRAVPILIRWLDQYSNPMRNKILKAIVQILGALSLNLFTPRELKNFRSYLLAALNDEDEEILEAALTGLSGVGEGDLEIARAVLELMERLDPVREHDLMQSALHCLCSVGYTEALREGFAAYSETVREKIIEACGIIGCRRCIGFLIDTFAEMNSRLQVLALSNLAKIADQTDMSFFLEVLDTSDSPELLREALSFIGNRIHCTVASPELLNLLEHPSDEVKEAALEACLALQDEEMNARLTGMFSNRNPMFRMMAVYAMGRIGAARYLSELTLALEDEVPGIRKFALEAIGGLCLEQPELFDRLMPRLNDESRDVRLALVELAGVMPQPKSGDVLLQVLFDEDIWVRVRAVEALGAHRVAKAVPHLIHMLESNEVLLLINVIEALGNIGGQAAFRALLSLTSHPDEEIQRAVSEAIAHIREEQGEEI